MIHRRLVAHAIAKNVGLASALLLVFASMQAACGKSVVGFAPCGSTTDCASGVCRSGYCKPVSCSGTGTSTCETGEVCVSGYCANGSAPPPVDGGPTPGKDAGTDSAISCTASTDCFSLGEACRNNSCVKVSCTSGDVTTPCLAGEECLSGSCVSIAGVPARASAAGGNVSTSSKHIHIGLTGQGQAVGAGASSAHTQQSGATSVMQR